MTNQKETNRKGRRLMKAVPKQINKINMGSGAPIPTEDMLLSQEDDLGMWKSTLNGYRELARQFDNYVKLGVVMSTAKVSEESIRDAFSGVYEREIRAGLEISARISANRHLVPAYAAVSQAVMRPKGTYTNPEIEALWSLMDDSEIPPMEVVREIASYANGMRDLTQMNVDWLKEKALKIAKAKKEERRKKSTNDLSINLKEKNDLVPESTEPEVKPLDLGGRELFATGRRWSVDPEDLQPIRTAALPDALIDIRNAFKPELTIKPISVANALQFALRPEVVARAKLIKHRFLTPEMQEWTRIPRGNDQIFLRDVSGEEQRRQMIFFITDAETVLRDAVRK